MKHLKRYKAFLEDGTATATATTAGMGAVSNAQPGALAGTTGTDGSGDISFYMLDKKGKKIKKGNPSEVSDARYLAPAKGITKLKESYRLTEEETSNYVKKDSIQTIRKSQVYLDSIDAKGNKFNLLKLIKLEKVG